MGPLENFSTDMLIQEIRRRGEEDLSRALGEEYIVAKKMSKDILPKMKTHDHTRQSNRVFSFRRTFIPNYVSYYHDNPWWRKGDDMQFWVDLDAAYRRSVGK